MTLPKAAMSSRGQALGQLQPLPQLSPAASTAPQPRGPSPGLRGQRRPRHPGLLLQWVDPGRRQALPSPSPLPAGSALRRRLSAAASSLGSPGRGEEPPPPPWRRKVSCGARGWEGEGRGLAPPLPCAFPPWAAGGGERERGRARPPARAACAGPGWGCAPRGLVSQAPGV